MRNMRLQVAVAAVVAGLGLVGTASETAAGTLTFIGGTGSDVSLLSSWSGTPSGSVPIGTSSAYYNDLIMQGSAASAIWSIDGNRINSITFDMDHDFTFPAKPVSGVLYYGLDSTTVPFLETKQAHKFAAPGGQTPGSKGYIKLYPGSSLEVNNILSSGGSYKVETSEGGTATFRMRFNSSNNHFWTLGAGITLETFVSSGSNSATLNSGLNGAGNVVFLNRGIVQQQDLTNHTGVLHNKSAGVANFHTTSIGTTEATFTAGTFIADNTLGGSDAGAWKGVVPVRLQGSTLSTTTAGGTFSASDNAGVYYGAQAKTLTMAGVSLRPGMTGAAVMKFQAESVFSKFDHDGDGGAVTPEVNSKLYIDVISGGTAGDGNDAVAGADYDQISLITSAAPGAGNTFGTIASASDASNRLADLELHINFAGLTQADVDGDVYTVFQTFRNFAWNATDRFANFSGLTGVDLGNGVIGDISYNAYNATDGTTITVSNVVVPEPGVVSLLAASGMLLGLRRQRRA